MSATASSIGGCGRIRASSCWSASTRAISTAEDVPEAPDLIVCDASFIGLATVLPAALALAAPGARLVALIKPQFEVGPDQVGKGGVVRDPALHREVCDRIVAWLETRRRLAGRRSGREPASADPRATVEFLVFARRKPL